MNLRILFSIFIIILSAYLLRAQVAFPTTLDAHWCYDAYTELSFDPWPYCISPSELVEFNGQTYSKISYYPHPNEQEQEALYRGEGRKFYVIPQDSTDEILIYDFDLEVGDTFVATWGWQIWGTETLEVWNTDTIVTIDGVARKRISLQNNSSTGTWIEGIGSENWIFVHPGYSFWLDAGYNPTCHFQEEAPIWSLFGNAEFCDLDELTSTSEIKLDLGLYFYPNPVQDQLTIQFPDSKNRPWKLLNINGEIVKKGEFNSVTEQMQLRELTSGVYFLQVTGFKVKRVLVGLRK